MNKKKDSVAGTNQGESTACGREVARTQIVVKAEEFSWNRGFPELEKYLGTGE